jgi:hypothetical protein
MYTFGCVQAWFAGNPKIRKVPLISTLQTGAFAAGLTVRRDFGTRCIQGFPEFWLLEKDGYFLNRGRSGPVNGAEHGTVLNPAMVARWP